MKDEHFAPRNFDEVLKEHGSEYLPGYLGIEIMNWPRNRLTSRMPVKKPACRAQRLPPCGEHRGPGRHDLRLCK